MPPIIFYNFLCETPEREFTGQSIEETIEDLIIPESANITGDRGNSAYAAELKSQGIITKNTCAQN
jgi:hypothetical protein